MMKLQYLRYLLSSLYFQYWVDWSSWLFGIRMDNMPYMHNFVIELGPLGLCWEWDESNE